MRKSIATMLALAMSSAAIIVPIVAALYLAHRQSMMEASGQALSLASDVLHRADAAGGQAIAAYQRLRKTGVPGDCTEATRLRLRQVMMNYSSLEAVGYVAHDRIVCSAIGPSGDGVDMGPPSYVSPEGTRVHLAANIGGDRAFVVLEAAGFAVAIYPETFIEVSTGTPDLSLGVYGRSARSLWAHRGPVDPAWLTRLHRAGQAVFFDGKHLVAIKASKRFDLAAYAAIPLTDLTSRLRSFLIILLPIGLILGAALAVMILFLARQRTSWPAVLRSALKRKEFVLHYQPIVELATGQMVGVEALLRWPANKEGGMRPALFIQAAEDCGLIQRFTEYVLAQVAIDGPRFFAEHPGASISINLSSMDLRTGEVLVWLRRVLGTPGIAPYNLAVEVTEHSFLDPTSASKVIGEIRDLGVRVAIDDFGTGFSSLSHLTRLRADYLKIDKVFIDAIGTDSVTSQVALHIIQMAKSLNLTVISEGVETQAQADFLREHGVLYAQGWLFSKAQPLDDLLQRVDPD